MGEKLINFNPLQILLNDVKNILLKYENINRETGNAFNVFEILNDNTDEVKICRFIYELLNPKGSHFQGIRFLKLFFFEVLKIDISDSELKETKIYREHLLKDSKRRMDIVIETPNNFIPIEVKIYSGDQNEQLKDYYLDSIKHNKKTIKIYYLTLFGTEPSDDSKKGLSNDKIELLSFKYDICNWITKCIKDISTLCLIPLSEVLRQFLQTVNKLTNNSEENVSMDITNIILSSKDNLKSSIEIENNINKAKIMLMRKYFDLLDNKLIENKISRYKIDYDYDYNNYEKCNQFYDFKKSTFPGITFKFKNKEDNDLNYDIFVRVEIDNSIFVGYCAAENDKNPGNLKFKNNIIKNIQSIDDAEFDDTNNWWLYWEYVNLNNDKINFKCPNDNFYLLVDDDKVMEIVDKTIEIVKKYLCI